MGDVQALDDLVAEIVGWGGVAYPGPHHPSAAAVVSSFQLRDFLDQCPYLKSEGSYVRYLERYNGVECNRGDKNLILSLPGLSHFLDNILANDYPLLNEQGFFSIGGSEFTPGLVRDWRSIIYHGFHIDGTGLRRPGIYRMIITGSDSESLVISPHEWYCETFIELLRRLVVHRGQIP
jgi:hypothetical protein